MNVRPRLPERAATAFSLIEILISVLILALGLLGLGALFPVVLREQRIGTDNINGVIATNNVKAMLAQMDLNMLMPTAGPPGRDVWGSWRWRQDDTTAELSNNDYELGEWDVCDVNANGGAMFGDRNTASARVEVPLAARLFPMAGSDKGRPQFVWDIAVHRYPDFVPGNSSRLDPLQAVIFVRRIDPRIRVPGGRTLRQVLLGDGVGGGDRRLPVGKQAGDNTLLPTLDGTDGSGGLEYSVPIVASRRDGDFGLVQGDGRYIVDVDTRQNDGKGSLMAQPNQKLVDNLGNIYTVETVERDPVNNSRVRLRIAPPIPASLTGPELNDRPHINQLIFTAQIPAGVVVTEVLR